MAYVAYAVETIPYLMYVENFAAVRWRTLGKPFLCMPLDSLITWRSPLISCTVRLMKI